MDRKLNWDFPLPRTHTGALLGNGVLGVMVWGQGQTLRITLGRADLWDHRGGLCWSARQNYREIRACLEANNEAGIREIFATDTERTPGQPARPTIVPVGRLELDLGAGSQLTTATLDLAAGELTVQVRKGRRDYALLLALDPREPVLMIACPPALRDCRVRPVPAWALLELDLAAIGFTRPTRFRGPALTGWVQPLPVDPGVCVGWQMRRGELAVAVEREQPAAARAAAAGRTAAALTEGYAAFGRRAASAWQKYWQDVPAVTLPNAALQELYDYGMYKFGAMTAPTGVAAGLQGPWIEEYQLPPWSADYHFNINVQMCYWPAYRGNRLQNLLPLFDLIQSWLPVLRENARLFIGVEDGILLPHAVDDRCTCMGSFWTGCIDHACTAWVAQMQYDYYRYSGDRAFLRDRAYPFMVGAMRVYEAMLERDGDALALPVSVSPEYRGAQMNAWGRNASFQLASIHRLAENLLDAAIELGETPSPVWQAVLEKLPKAALVEHHGRAQIGLWEGLVLEESHRHHSHLAGIAPFDTLDLDDPVWRERIRESLALWTHRGMGLWSGWCVPWASMLHSRCGNGPMAELLLETWRRVFTNVGRGTLHDADFAGFTLMGGPTPFAGRREGHREIMQMDAGMGAVAAIQEMLLHERRGVLHLFQGAPAEWPEVAFGPMRVPGAFLVSARRQGGAVSEVGIDAPHAGTLRLANPWAGTRQAVTLKRGAKRMSRRFGDVIELRLKAGERVVLQPA